MCDQGSGRLAAEAEPAGRGAGGAGAHSQVRCTLCAGATSPRGTVSCAVGRRRRPVLLHCLAALPHTAAPPPLRRPTQETLAAMMKVCRVEGEAAKVSVRHARKTAMDTAKKAGGSEDARKRVEKEVQKLTDDYIKEVCVCGERAGHGSQQPCPGRQPGAPCPQLLSPPHTHHPQVENMIAKKEKSITLHNS